MSETSNVRRKRIKLGDVDAQKALTNAPQRAKKASPIPKATASVASGVANGTNEALIAPLVAPKIIEPITLTPQTLDFKRPSSKKPEVQEAIEEAYDLPYTPPSFHFAPSDDPHVELASRELCRRKLLPFIQRFRPKYTAGWVHEDICRRIERFVEQVERGESPRLLLLCPPRSGKSEIGSRHAAPWALGKHPDWEIIATSNSASLSLSFSRYIRDVLRDPAYQSVFPEARLDPSSQSIENWNLTNGGGYMAAGVGTGIVGRGCFIGETLIYSEAGPVEMSTLVRLHKSGFSPRVLAYDHSTGVPEYKNVIATHEETSNELIEITLTNGRTVRCTPNHTIFVEDCGYIAAELLRGGETVYITQSMPNLFAVEESGQQGMPTVLRKHSSGEGGASMFELFEDVCAVEARSGQSRSTRACSKLLFKDLQRESPRGEECETVCSVRGTCPVKRGVWSCKILQRHLPTLVKAAKTAINLPSVRSAVRKAKSVACLLFTSVFGVGAQLRDTWREEPELLGRISVSSSVPETSRVNTRERQAPLCDLFEQAGHSGTSCRRGQGSQYTRESSDVVQNLPLGTPSVERGSVAVVGRIRGNSHVVYDLQVEDHSNYFAETLLVHNCHILLVDDVVRDMESADSPTIRESIWEWYLSVAYTRLAPGGGVLGILTWWNEDDWAGRIQQAMATGDGDTFEVVKYPAINDIGDEYILPDDSIEQIRPGEVVPEGSRLTRPKDTALHPARYDTKMMLNIKRNFIAGGQKRIWDALYQQNPTPDDGNFFTKEMFRFYGTAPARSELYVYQAWDFAISTGKDSDYTVGMCIGVDHRDNVYLLDMRRFRSGDGGAIVDTILDFSAEHDADLLGFEDGQIWKAIEFQFSKRCEERRQYPSYEILKPLTDKMVRANPLKGRMQLGKVYFDKNMNGYGEMYREMIVFPAGKHDDCIDSLSWAIRLTLTRSAPRPKDTQPKFKSWKDKLGQHMDGAGGSHMCA